MYLTIKLTDEAKRRIAKDGRLADRFGRTVAGALEGAAAVGAEEIRQALYLGELGLNPSSAEGLAGSVSSWMLQRAGAGRPVAAIGVAANTRAGRSRPARPAHWPCRSRLRPRAQPPRATCRGS